MDSNSEELNDFNDVGETHNRVSKEQPSTEAVKFYQLFELLTQERLQILSPYFKHSFHDILFIIWNQDIGLLVYP